MLAPSWLLLRLLSLDLFLLLLELLLHLLSPGIHTLQQWLPLVSQASRFLDALHRCLYRILAGGVPGLVRSILHLCCPLQSLLHMFQAAQKRPTRGIQLLPRIR